MCPETSGIERLTKDFDSTYYESVKRPTIEEATEQRRTGLM